MSKNLILIIIFLLARSFLCYSQKTIGANKLTPRMRVIVDNDFSGDPDGLFQLTHLLLSPSVEVRSILGSHLKAGDGFDPSRTQAQNAAKKAKEVLQLLDLKSNIPVFAGSNT